MRRMAGKVAIVAGARTGIGQGIDKRLGNEDAKVVVDGIGDASGAVETRHAVEQSGSELEIVGANVTKSGGLMRSYYEP